MHPEFTKDQKAKALIETHFDYAEKEWDSLLTREVLLTCFIFGLAVARPEIFDYLSTCVRWDQQGYAS